MIIFPCAKINLGLNVVSRREDGYHNIETVFYPIPLYDALEIKTMSEEFPSEYPCDLKITGNAIECNEQENLVVKAYNLMASNFSLPRVHIHLNKSIPSQAGLGGGSSDAAFMIRLLDNRFRMNIGNAEMEKYAASLGADCAFFITAEPTFATGIGDKMSQVDISENYLKGFHVVLVKPDIQVSTKEAYARITPQSPAKSCRIVVGQPISTWKDELSNDFEKSVFSIYPELDDIKQKLYSLGADYAQMSGSGSTIFGIFRHEINSSTINKMFPDCYTKVLNI